MIKQLLFVLLFAFTLGVKRYDGYKVYRVHVKNREQADFIMNLADKLDLDIWNGLSVVGQPIDVMVSPKTEVNFLKAISKKGILFEIFIQNVQSLIDGEQVSITRMKALTWDSYHDLDDIYCWLDDLPNVNPAAKTIIGGSSHEGREIKGVKISFKPGKRAVFIEGGINGREWISPATVTFLINQLLTNDDRKFRDLVDNFDWYIFPVVNPDEYSYTHTHSRLFKKTRTTNSNCLKDETSTEPCSNGDIQEFSDWETSSISKFIKNIATMIDIFLFFNSYGQTISLPKSCYSENLENCNNLLKVSKAAIDAVSNKYNTTYHIKNTTEFRNNIDTNMDWIFKTYKIPIVLTYELRDEGKSGFILPAAEIIPNGFEITDSIMELLNKAKQLEYFNMN